MGGAIQAWWRWGGEPRPSPPSFRIQLKHHLFQESSRILPRAEGASPSATLKCPYVLKCTGLQRSSEGLGTPGGPASPVSVQHKAWWEQLLRKCCSTQTALKSEMWMRETSP